MASAARASSSFLVLVLLLNLLNHSLDFNRLSVVDAQVVLIFLEGSAHAVKSLSNLSTLVSDERLSKEALCASVVVTAKLLIVPVVNVP